jgi:hypothetical protein
MMWNRVQHATLVAAAMAATAAPLPALDRTAENRARSLLATGDPASVRTVIRSFHIADGYQSSMEAYRSLLIEAKRLLEPRFDEAVAGQPMDLTPAEKLLQDVLTKRLHVSGLVPQMPRDPFDPAAFQQAMAELLKLEEECAKGFLANPEAARMIMRPVAPAIEESLMLINSELARFYPAGGLWIALEPLGGSFRGVTLRERKNRLDGYIDELRARPAAHAAAAAFIDSQPDGAATAFTQIQRFRAALGLPLLVPNEALAGITRDWADEAFALLEIPPSPPDTAESDLETLARDARIRNYIRYVATMPGDPADRAIWQSMLTSAELIRILLDPDARHIGVAHFPTGLVIVMAEN